MYTVTLKWQSKHKFWQMFASSALQRRTWSPFCRLVTAFLYKVRALLSKDQSAVATTAMAAASRSLPLSVSHRYTGHCKFECSFVMSVHAACMHTHCLTFADVREPHCIICASYDIHHVPFFFSCFYSRLSEHAQYEFHLSWIRQWVDGAGRCVVELCCWAEKRRHQRNNVKGSTTLVPYEQCLLMNKYTLVFPL